MRKECLPDASADGGRLDEEEVQFAGIGATRWREEIETENGGRVDGDECRRRLECLRVDGELRAPPFEPVARVALMRFGTEREVAEQPGFISPRPPVSNRCAGHHCSGSFVLCGLQESRF